AYGHYTEFGLWNDAADLFATNAVLQLGDVNVTGRENIRRYFLNEVGRGQLGLAPGRLHTELFLSPVVTLSADGRLAKGRWHAVSMLGEFGKSASWAGGIYENEYVKEEGKWRISKLHYFPQYAGPYDPGWRNLKKETPETVAVVPYHYTPDSAGTPIPLSPQIAATPRDASPKQLARQAEDLARRASRLTDESEVRNLQHAFGFYLDRRMWDDIVDLFVDDGTFEMGQMGVFQGKASIRRLLESFGPQRLREGELNDQLQLQTLVTVSEDGKTAHARGTQLSMTGTHGGAGYWATGTYENEYVKQDGVWKIRSVHIYSRMRTNYDQGWGVSAEPVQGPDDKVRADRPPTERYQNYPDAFYIPAFHYAHPVTGKPPQYPKGVRASRPPIRAEKSGQNVGRSDQEPESALAEIERLIRVATAYDGSENVANAYGYYIDEFLWTETGELFATDGWKELSYIGTYVGRDRVRDSMIKRYGNKGRRANSLAIHQKTQPVIHVAPDGRSAKVRTRLFQINSASDADGSYIAGIYENRTVLENGIWKIAAMDLDYTWTASYRKGWTRIEAGAQRRYAPPSQFSQDYPPDRPLRGVHYAPFPQVPDLAFHYRNPVSGRAPPVLLPE
ncbi:MAG TPA: nuclear transport factor 2 family protein, partial [Steroidobacteraceae bacterium]